MPSKKSKGLGGARAEMLSGDSMGQVVTWPDRELCPCAAGKNCG